MVMILIINYLGSTKKKKSQNGCILYLLEKNLKS